VLAFDTNLAVHAANTASPLHDAAFAFIESLAANREVVVCELMLVALYLKLRNEKIFPRPLGPAQAAAVCQTYRSNRAWMLVDSAPVMDETWRLAAARGFAFRRIIDVRLALTLIHHGATEFATTNAKDFHGLGFARVWNPLAG
jgi:uncharacterized protein